MKQVMPNKKGSMNTTPNSLSKNYNETVGDEETTILSWALVHQRIITLMTQST